MLITTASVGIKNVWVSNKKKRPQDVAAYPRFHWLHKQLHLFYSIRGWGWGGGVGRLIKPRGEVEKPCLRDSGTLALGYWFRSLIYKLIVATYCPVHPVSAFTNRQQLFRNQPNVEIFCNCWCRGIVTSEGIQQWPFKRLGVHVMFPPNAVSEPTSIVVHKWKHNVCSPPLQEHETITSNVIELSAMARQGLKFNTKVKLSLSHSGTDLRGYELVIKKQIDKETNIWEEVDGTIDIRCREGIGNPFIP